MKITNMEGTVIIKGKEYTYRGATPLKVAVLNSDFGWIPKTNLYISDSVGSPDLLGSIEDCKKYIRNAQKSKKYVSAYILDYINKVIYYDDSDALLHANALLRSKKQEGYFIKFVEIENW